MAKSKAKAEKKSKPKAAKAPKVEQAHFEGMEPIRIKEIDDAAEEYRGVKAKAHEVLEEKKAVKKALREAMRSHRAELIEGTIYRYEDADGVRQEVSIEEGVTVRKVKAVKPAGDANGITDDFDTEKDELE